MNCRASADCAATARNSDGPAFLPHMPGRTSHDIDAAGLIWQFFRRQWPAGG